METKVLVEQILQGDSKEEAGLPYAVGFQTLYAR